MPSSVHIVSRDAAFAGSMGSRLERWGLRVAIESGIESVTPALLDAEQTDVVLLDAREHDPALLQWLSSIKQTVPALEVILLTRPGEIGVSIDAMRAGASNELSTPFDTATLRRTISAALRRRNKRLDPDKPSLLERFQQVMTAATFAQAGEFETAREILGERRTTPRGRRRSTKADRE